MSYRNDDTDKDHVSRGARGILQSMSLSLNQHDLIAHDFRNRDSGHRNTSSRSAYFVMSLSIDRIYDYENSILRQDFTWDYLCTDSDVLFRILLGHKVFPEFLDCVHAFGLKLYDDDEAWEGCHRSFQIVNAESNDDVDSHYGKFQFQAWVG
jgi:hypothetical protein